MKRYLRVRGSTSGPLFIFADHTPISASYFARRLAACLSHCGYDTTRYTGHSFRIGRRPQPRKGVSLTFKSKTWADGNLRPFAGTFASS
jgi:hypothetical protein